VSGVLESKRANECAQQSFRARRGESDAPLFDVFPPRGSKEAFGITMKAFETLAVEFAQSLVDAKWENARGLLSPSLQQQYSAEQLAQEFKSMYEGYAEGPARSIHFDPQYSMEAWPDKQPGDIGWAYVSIEGNGFVEAVTVVIASSNTGLAVRDIDWGRP